MVVKMVHIVGPTYFAVLQWKRSLWTQGLHIRGEMLAETGYGQAQSRQGTVFQSTVAGYPQLQWPENIKSLIINYLF